MLFKRTFIIKGRYLPFIIFCVLFLDAILLIFNIQIINLLFSLLLNLLISWLVIILTRKYGYLTIFNIKEKTLYQSILKVMEEQNIAYKREVNTIKLIDYNSELKLDYFSFEKRACLQLNFTDNEL